MYGPDIVIKKEECINHVSKRLGTALRSTVKDCCAQGISLGGKAHGSLKEATIKKLTTYYQKAILRNKGDVNAMKTAIYATLLHSISTDAKPQHSKCPAGENSWCFYQSAIANGEKPNNHKLNVGTPINEKFLPKILPIYQRLASNELLERCIRCGTQNANESLHSMIWAKCPKEIFVNKRRVKRAVTEAVCEYNKGTVRTIVETQKALGVATGGSTKQLATILDCRKQKFRKRRQNASEVITSSPEHTNDDKLSLRSRWDIVQKMKLGFWRKWKMDYLSNLQNRTKWKSPNHNFKVGEIVIIKEDNIPPATWPLGKVIETHPGKDGVVRVVTLRTVKGRFKRPIHKLCKLPLHQE
ncbi:uncharacterized protein TNCV_197701 [Trichonephila clavipes]|nr:uncharacterized protein TNCV_197701 [Trichonephila clavipes]